MIERPARDEAQRLLREGRSYEAVSRKLGMSERTIRRWDEDWGIRKKGGIKLAITPDTTWPQERLWDSKTLDPMLESLGLSEESLLVHKSVVAAAVNSSNLWIQWYERSWVRFMANHKHDDELLFFDKKFTGAYWIDGLAGIPVLCEWLGGSSICSEIVSRALEHRPWQANPLDRRTAAVEGRGERLAKAAAKYLPRAEARIKYGAAVRGRVKDLKNLISQQLVTRSVMMTAKGPTIISPNEPLIGLMGRVPMFDMEPKKSAYRKFSVWDLFIGIFMSEPLEAVK